MSYDRKIGFSLDVVSEENTDEVGITIYDGDRNLIAQCRGDSFPDVLKHAMYIADPILTNWVFGSEFMEWQEAHQLEED